MYINVFDRFLENDKKHSSYLLYGDESYMLELYTSKIINHHGIGTDDINYIYFDEYNYEKLLGDIRQNSLFCETNFFVIKTDKKLDSKQVKNIVQLAKENVHSVIIFAIKTKEKLATYEKYFIDKNDGVFVRFFKPQFDVAINLLRQKADSLGMNYEYDAMETLYLLHEEDLGLSINDLNKLAICDKKINSKIIYGLCFGMGHMELQEFLFDIFEDKADTKEIQKITNETDEIYMVMSLATFVQELLMINCYTRMYGTANARDILGYQPPPAIWNKKVAIASSFSQKKFLELLNYFADMEMTLKSNNNIDKKGYMISKLINLSLL